MLAARAPQSGLIKVEIFLGTGSRARTRWWNLNASMSIGKRALRKMGNVNDARVLYEWQLTSRWLVLEAPHWTLELSGEEWQALSRALRHSGVGGRSMLAWINNHKEDTHVEGR